MPDRQKSCKELVRGEMESTMHTIGVLWAAHTSRDYDEIKGLYDLQVAFEEKWPKLPRKGSAQRKERDAEESKLQEAAEALDYDDKFLLDNIQDAECHHGADGIYDYGLGFDYVEYDRKADYGDFFRWQLSWGGPSDEIQFYVTADRRQLRYAEYRYMDWFDGAGVQLTGEHNKLACHVYEWFYEGGVVENAYTVYAKGLQEECG